MVKPGFEQRLDDLIEASLSSRRVVGGKAILAVDGTIAYSRAYGLMDREAATPMRADAIYRMASCSKAIVSVAALALQDAGLISVEDPVTKYLPDFRPKLKDGSAPEILIRHLLSHTSGITYDCGNPLTDPEAASSGLDHLAVDMAENMRRIVARGLAFAPGTAWAYGVGIDVAGAVLEQAGGRSLPDIVAHYVTGPLGLKDLIFSVEPGDRLATAYGEVPGGNPPDRMTEPYVLVLPESRAVLSPARAFRSDVFPSGGAGMISSPDDYLAFFEALRKGGAPILSPKAMGYLARGVTAGLDMGAKGRTHSLGWSIWDDPALEGKPYAPGSWNWGGLYGHSWLVDPVNRLTFVSFTNVAADDGGLAPEIYSALYGT